MTSSINGLAADKATLLTLLISGAPAGTSHFLTLLSEGGHVDTCCVQVGEDGEALWEFPLLPTMIDARIAGGSSLSVVMRTFDDARVVPNPIPGKVSLPIKIVRGWFITRDTCNAVPAAEMRDAMYTDAVTGKPLPVQADLEFADAWSLPPAA